VIGVTHFPHSTRLDASKFALTLHRGLRIGERTSDVQTVRLKLPKLIFIAVCLKSWKFIIPTA